MKKYNEIPYYSQTSRIIHIDGENVEVFASEVQDLDKMCENAKKNLSRVKPAFDSSPTWTLTYTYNPYRYNVTTTSSSDYYVGTGNDIWTMTIA